MASGSAVALYGVVGPMAEGLGVPTQGHTSLTENDDEMLVTSVTGTQTTPSVQYVDYQIVRQWP
jgi:hypothetical protein